MAGFLFLCARPRAHQQGLRVRENVQLKPDEADEVAGAGLGFNHNQTAASDEPGDEPVAEQQEEIELKPDETEEVAGAGWNNHNQTAATDEVGAEAAAEQQEEI